MRSKRSCPGPISRPCRLVSAPTACSICWGRAVWDVVYRAQATSGGATAPIVALKALRPGVVTTQLEQRFRREVAVLRRLDHPGIARLLDAGSADGSPYLAMEFVEGLTLTRWRIEVDPPVADRLRLLAELCDAAEYAHQQGVIHRDPKPENILVTAAGRPKVLDFASRGSPTPTPAQTWPPGSRGTIPT
ncbi:MAG: protein kinase [bacterium]|nr:protein kinase [bacterium]